MASGKGKASGKLIRAALRSLRKTKKRRRGHPDAVPTRRAAPPRQASHAARREADRAQAAGRSNGTAEAVTTADGRHTVSTQSGAGYPLHRRVEGTINTMPPGQRADWHGECALPQALSRMLDRGIDPTGGAVGSARIRAPGHRLHGTQIPPCPSCAPLMRELNLREAM
jgi:hypothetical protein